MSRRGGSSQTPHRGRRKEIESSSSEEEVESSEEESGEEEEVGNKRKRAGGSKPTPQKRTPSSQSTQSSQKETKAVNLTDEERHKLVYEFVRFILFSNRKKVPITKTEINKNVLSRFKDRNLTNYVYKMGIKHLEDIFGLKLMELNKKSKSEYILVNLNKYEYTNALDEIDEKETRDTIINNENLTLLTVILGIILLEGGHVDSPQLNQFLAPLGFSIGDNHPVFGDLDKLLEKFTKEQYLTRRKNIVDNEAIWVYEMGERSYAETSERYILNFISDLYGCDPDPLLLKEIEQKEKENNTFSNSSLSSTRGKLPRLPGQQQIQPQQQQRNNNANSRRQIIEDDEEDEEEDDEEEPPQQSQRRQTTTTTTTSTSQRPRR